MNQENSEYVHSCDVSYYIWRTFSKIKIINYVDLCMISVSFKYELPSLCHGYSPRHLLRKTLGYM